jgi:hypothetical protein
MRGWRELCAAALYLTQRPKQGHGIPKFMGASKDSRPESIPGPQGYAFARY